MSEGRPPSRPGCFAAAIHAWPLADSFNTFVVDCHGCFLIASLGTRPGLIHLCFRPAIGRYFTKVQCRTNLYNPHDSGAISQRSVSSRSIPASASRNEPVAIFRRFVMDVSSSSGRISQCMDCAGSKQAMVHIPASDSHLR